MSAFNQGRDFLSLTTLEGIHVDMTDKNRLPRGPCNINIGFWGGVRRQVVCEKLVYLLPVSGPVGPYLTASLLWGRRTPA